MTSKQQLNNANAQLQQQQQQQRAALSAAAEKHLKMGPNSTQQITAAIIQQQNRAIAHQNRDKYNSLSSMDKQRLFKSFDKKQFDAPMIHSDNSHSRSHDRGIQPPQLPSRSPQIMNSNAPLDLQQQSKQQISHKVIVNSFLY